LEKDIKHLFGSVRAELEFLLQEIKNSKSLASRLSPNDQYAALVNAGILENKDVALTIRYDYPTCLVISLLCEEDLQNSIPIQSLREAIPIGRKVTKSLNKQGITSGTAEFMQQLIKELILNAHYHGVDVPGQILALNNSSAQYFEIVNSLALVVPQLPLPLATRYTLYAHIYSLTYNDGASGTIFTSLREFIEAEGKELLTLAVQNNNKLPGFVANLLLGLSTHGKENAWIELEKLSKIGYELETLNALANIKIDSGEDAQKIASHIKDAYPTNESTIPYLVWAYANIVNSSETPHQVRQGSLASLRTFGEVDNERIHLSLVSISTNLKVSDEIKLEIIASVNFKNANLAHPLFHLARKFSETYNFFVVIRNVVSAQRLTFDASEIRHYLINANNAHPVEFSQELVEMLTDKNGLIRFGGSRILQVIHSEQTPFKFQIDILSLSAHHQSRMIKAIAGDILHPTNVIRFIALFRYTKHQQVLQSLVNALAGVFEDYHHDAIIILRAELDANVDVDKELLAIFEKYHTNLAEIITKKNSLEEFSPYKNQARAFEHFLRLTRNKMREKINRDQEKNPIFDLVHRVSIARGKSWKIEKNDREPSPLQLISSEITYPRMSLMNPDQYNWDIVVNASTDYKNG
jgi:hypothetical protein